MDALFTPGNVFTVHMARVRPDIQGMDGLGRSTGQVVSGYSQWSFSYKRDLTPQTAMLLMQSQPMGLDIHYGSQHSSLVGGTQAHMQAHEVLGALRYRWNDRWSVHGGLRLQRSEGHVGFGGLAFGAGSGYRVDLRPSTAPGYLMGLTYEVPELALRVTGTYFSAIHHTMDTRESLAPSLTTRTQARSPHSVNLDLQTAITPSTLLYGQIRWTQWSQFRISPAVFSELTGGASLTDMEDSTTYTLGLAQKLSAQWSALLAWSYDHKNSTNTLSALRPSNGRVGYTLGVNYKEKNWDVLPWVSYQRLGGADIYLSNYRLGNFGQSSALAFGVRLGYVF